ncbi:MAG: hypothetical protein P8144_07640 [Gammaproteobacteria bacterium]
MKTVSQFVREHTLFNGMPSEQVDFIAGCGQLQHTNSMAQQHHS